MCHITHLSTKVHILGSQCLLIFGRSMRVYQGPDNNRKVENKCSQIVCLQLPLCTASLGTFARTVKKVTAFIMPVCPSVCIYQHGLQWMDSCEIIYWGLYGNLIHSRLGWSMWKVSAIATMTVQSHDYSPDQVFWFAVLCFTMSNVMYLSMSWF